MKTKVLIYCTKAKPYLLRFTNGNKLLYKLDNQWYGNVLNGKIVAEFECDKAKVIKFQELEDSDYGPIMGYLIDDIDNYCLDYEELEEYGTKHIVDTNGEEYDYFADLYDIHITNLKPFDKPLELSEVYSLKDIGGGFIITRPLAKAPKNMQRVSICSCEYGFAPSQEDIRIIISCSPKECVNILNGIQTSLVRKKILRGM